jgi:hypothetical protein
MDRLIALVLFLIGVFIAIVTYPDQAAAVLTLSISAGAVVLLISKTAADDAAFLQRIFLLALLARLTFGLAVVLTGNEDFFGGDAKTYDGFGFRLYQIWFEGFPVNDAISQRATSTSIPGWGMVYFVAVIYTITGKNPLAAQFICVVIGAASAPMAYALAYKMFHNRQVGKMAAIFVAFFPAFIIWSSQLLKDGVIVFLLLVTMTLVLKLHEKFSYTTLLLLIFSMFGIVALRFYIFYMVVIAVVGGFVIGSAKSNQSILKRLAAVVVIGLAFTYLGVIRTAEQNIETYGNLKSINLGRKDMAMRAESGFGGEDIDVSTTEGAISTMPIGLTYLLLAPFPWQATNIRQAIVMPEVFVWWALLPMMVTGIIYTVRHNLRNALPVMIFTLMLALAYSIFQGNVGTAYRQRTQIQVFLFIFIAVGWVLKKEKKENARAETAKKRKKFLEAHAQLAEKTQT